MATEPSPGSSAAPVRLRCRYSNGLVTNALARAVSHEGDVLRVLCSEQFEAGVQLTAQASFLSGAQACRVLSARRSEQPGYFLLDLKLPAAVQPAPAPQVAKAPVDFTIFAAELAARLDDAGAVPLYRAAFQRATSRERQGFIQCAAAAIFVLLARKGHLDASQVLKKLKTA